MTASSTRPAARKQTRRSGRLAGAALLLSGSFIASRLLGMLRTSAITYSFGQGRATDAYFAAFNIPDTMFTLVSGAAMATAFVPTFASLLERDRDDEAWDVASTVLNSVFVTFAVLAGVLFVLAPLLMHGLTAGFAPGERDLAVQLTRIMLLQPIFLGVAAIVSSILQTYGRFAPTAIAPMVYNLAVIIGAVLFKGNGVTALAWSVVVGAVLYLVIQIPAFQHQNAYRLTINWSSSAAREVLRLLGPRVAGLAAFRVMLVITVVLASGLPTGALSAINYAWMLIQFPIGALGTAAGTAVFPTLSRLSAGDDFVALRRTLNRGLSLVLFLAVPASAGLIVLRRPIINVLYHHGSLFTFHNTEQTALALVWYAAAVPALAAIEILPRVFYAMKDTVTPVRIAVVAVTLDAALSIVLVKALPRNAGQGGLAFATAASSIVQAVWLARSLDINLDGIGWSNIVGTLRDTLLASGAMALVLYVSLDVVAGVLPQVGLGVLVTVCIEVPIGAATFAWVSYLLGAPELWEARGLLRR